MTKRIMVLGGDGFCGWPASLHLSSQGHEVCIADNLSRRAIDNELGANSLTPITPIHIRQSAWKEVSGASIRFENIDVSRSYGDLLRLIQDFQPDTIIHFAEQRAAPYSMKSARHKAYTVRNNVCGTNNVLSAIVESGMDIHLVHLGTMGVYGYAGNAMTLPEGYQTVWMKNDHGELCSREIIYPTSPGSIYHWTKTVDQSLFQFYAHNDGVRITDLHQGIVWGTQTEQTKQDVRLINRFDYDGDYGTVLNRFLMQAAIGHPLTVHGTGGQTRAFIHISDTVKCVEFAANNPPEAGARPNIHNQLAETKRLIDLAKLVVEISGGEISFVDNPRKEAASNDLAAHNDSLRSLGWEPLLLDTALMEEISEISARYSHRCDVSRIPCTSLWNRQQRPGMLPPAE